MALFRVTVRKAIGGSTGINYKWSNVYYVNAADANNAVNIGIGIWSRERSFHSDATYCYQVYASDLVPNTVNFAQGVPLAANQFGTYVNSGNDWYHSSVVQRVDLFVPLSRPSRKFYRPPFTEPDIADGQTTLAAFNTALSTGMALIAVLPEIRDESGNNISGWGNMGLTTRRLGRDAFHDIPLPQGA